MSAITCPSFTELDRDIIEDFMECLQENIESIEACIELLDREPSAALINQLFRDVHSLKGNCRMVFLDPMVEVIHCMEEVVSDMRQGEREYTQAYGEFFMSVVVRQEAGIERLANQGEIDGDAQAHMLGLIEQIHAAGPKEAQSVLESALSQLSGGGSVMQEESTEAEVAAPEPLAEPEPEASVVASGENDLDFFRNLARQLDSIDLFRADRTQKILELCLATNADMGQEVDEAQLTAAVYLHDLGMALVPRPILDKPGQLTEPEFATIKGHVHVGAGILKRIEGWEAAAAMVEQHHEKFDGSGYPAGLRGEAIHPGAMIIALADTFYAVTNARADRSYKKSLFSAVSMINGQSGEQFDPRFVESFNTTIRRLYVSR